MSGRVKAPGTSLLTPESHPPPRTGTPRRTAVACATCSARRRRTPGSAAQPRQMAAVDDLTDATVQEHDKHGAVPCGSPSSLSPIRSLMAGGPATYAQQLCVASGNAVFISRMNALASSGVLVRSMVQTNRLRSIVSSTRCRPSGNTVQFVNLVVSSGPTPP